VDSDLSPAGIDELLGHFVTAALGLTLDGRIFDPDKLPPEHRGCLIDSTGRPRAWVAWHTHEGTVSACALYDRAQSAHMKAVVLRISWWIGTRIHHDGWYHCYPKRPREWIKGCGR
jgi:hypothetical protein